MDLFSKEYATYGVSWFFMSMVVAGIAQGKGRSGLNWWLIAMLFSPPVALFFLVAFCSNVHEHPVA